jgi:hypothetical protein
MQSRVYRFIALAAGLVLASGCSGDNSAAPVVQSDINANATLASAIKSDIGECRQRNCQRSQVDGCK